MSFGDMEVNQETGKVERSALLVLAGVGAAESEISTFTMPKCAILLGPHRPELLIAPGDAFMQQTAAGHLVGSSLPFLGIQ